jgi:hypothetical protein
VHRLPGKDGDSGSDRLLLVLNLGSALTAASDKARKESQQGELSPTLDMCCLVCARCAVLCATAACLVLLPTVACTLNQSLIALPRGTIFARDAGKPTKFLDSAIRGAKMLVPGVLVKCKILQIAPPYLRLSFGDQASLPSFASPDCLCVLFGSCSLPSAAWPSPSLHHSVLRVSAAESPCLLRARGVLASHTMNLSH